MKKLFQALSFAFLISTSLSLLANESQNIENSGPVAQSKSTPITLFLCNDPPICAEGDSHILDFIGQPQHVQSKEKTMQD